MKDAFRIINSWHKFQCANMIHSYIHDGFGTLEQRLISGSQVIIASL